VNLYKKVQWVDAVDSFPPYEFGTV